MKRFIARHVFKLVKICMKCRTSSLPLSLSLSLTHTQCCFSCSSVKMAVINWSDRPLAVVAFSLRCACYCFLDVLLVSLVVPAIHLALSFHCHTYAHVQAHTHTHKHANMHTHVSMHARKHKHACMWCMHTMIFLKFFSFPDLTSDAAVICWRSLSSSGSSSPMRVENGTAGASLCFGPRSRAWWPYDWERNTERNQAITRPSRGEELSNFSRHDVKRESKKTQNCSHRP